MVRQRGFNPQTSAEILQKFGNPEQPHSDLVPLGNTGIYVNPDKPVDPWDCERWDGSLFCGGNPWGGFVPEIDISPVIDECNIGIQAQPQGFGIKFPEFQVVYRRPECRDKEPPPPREVATQNIPQDWGQFNFKDTDLCICFLGESRYVYYKTRRPGFTDLEEMEYTAGISCSGVSYNLYQNRVPLLHETWTGRELGRATCTFSIKQSVNQVFLDYWKYSPGSFPRDFEEQTTKEKQFLKNRFGTYLSQIYFFPSYSTYGENFWVSSLYLSERTGFLVALYGNWGNIKGAFPNKRIVYENTVYSSGQFISYEKRTADYEVFGVAMAELPPPPKYRKPPPPPKEKCCTMGCCPPKNSDNNDRLLRLILQKVTKLEKVTGDPISPVKTVFDGFDRIIKFLGIKEMPAKFPKRLIYPNGKGQVELNNLLEILGYQVKQLDRAIGHLPQKIKVTDTNPAQSGNQSVEVEVHSLADFNREILKYLIDTEGDVDATNNMLVRCLYELGFIHQGVVQADAMLDALVEWADFKQVYKKIKVPFAFDPYAGQKGKVGQGFDKQKNTGGKGATTEEEVEDLLPKLLQNKEVEIRILVNGESKSVNDLLQDIKRDTAAAAAGVSEKSSPERLEQLVAASQLVLKLQGAIDRNNSRTALTAGFLKTKPKKNT